MNDLFTHSWNYHNLLVFLFYLTVKASFKILEVGTSQS